VLLDQTGLVRSISPGAGAGEATPSTLTVNWYVCRNTTLTFDRAAGGFLLTEVQVDPCGFFFGTWRSLQVQFWSPIDASRVVIDLPQ
jgi:hypothetical protein